MKTAFFILLFSVCLLQTNAYSQVTLTINTAQNRQPISPLIYGVNYSAGNASGIYTAQRLGGDAMSTYNWETNYSTTHWWSGNTYISDNNDWVPYTLGLNGGNYTPGQAIVTFRNYANAHQAYSLVQLSCMGLVAKDMAGNIDATQCTAGFSSGRFLNSQVVKGSALSLAPNLADSYVYTDEELNFLINQCGKASTTNGIKGYCIDNEPGGWNTTHPCNHKSPATCTEVLTKNISLSQRIKTLDSTAEVFGPELMNYTDYTQLVYPAPTDWSSYNMSDTTYNPADFNYTTFACSFLRRMKNASAAYGKRLLDVFSIHFYNEGASLLQDSRSFWDSTYVENSWITQSVIVNTPIKLLPNMNKCIQHFYPGTKLAITEYGNFDAATSTNNVATGIYTADVLGAFGKNGVYMGNYFNEPTGYVLGAFKMFRNYDGANGSFGNISVQSQSSNNSKVTAYASVSNALNDTLHLLLINRDAASQPLTIQLNSSATYTDAKVYAMENSGSGALTVKPNITSIAGNLLSYTVPAKSVYHLVLYSTTNPCPNPPKVTIANTAPIVCAGKSTGLTATNIAGATYAWQGPNGFTSNVRNPVLKLIQTTATGTYKVTVTTPTPCIVTATTSVLVNPQPLVNATNTGPYCHGAPITVQAAAGATSYVWTYTQNGVVASHTQTTNSFTDTGIGSPSIASRTYTATVTNSYGCTNTGTTIAKIYTPNSVSAVYTISVLPTGKRINLAATTVTGGTYLWTGPNGFTSTLRNPQIANATPLNNGLYSVVVTSSYGCVLNAIVNVMVPTSKLSANELIVRNGIHVFPNPSSSGVFNLVMQTGKAVQWTIISADGIVLLKGSFTSGNGKIDLSSLPKGVYLLKVGKEGEETEMKLVR